MGKRSFYSARAWHKRLKQYWQPGLQGNKEHLKGLHKIGAQHLVLSLKENIYITSFLSKDYCLIS